MHYACGYYEEWKEEKSKADLKVVKELLKKYPALLNEDLQYGNTPLHTAAEYNQLQIVKHLMSLKGVPLNKGEQVSNELSVSLFFLLCLSACSFFHVFLVFFSFAGASLVIHRFIGLVTLITVKL
jgi:ankyrin repeat protein